MVYAVHREAVGTTGDHSQDCQREILHAIIHSAQTPSLYGQKESGGPQVGGESLHRGCGPSTGLRAVLSAMGGPPGAVVLESRWSELNFVMTMREKIFRVQFILPKLNPYMGRMNFGM
jgi:hypothetical protein